MYQQQYHGQQPMDTNPSCLQMQVRPQQFAPSWQAPFPQAIQQTPPALMNDVPHIANAVGNIVAQCAQMNPAYMYYYNVVGYQNFNNDQFMKLVEFAARYYLLLITQRAVASPVDGMNQAADFAVRMMASITVLETPQLHQFISREIYDASAQIASKMQSIVAQFSQMSQQYQQPTGYTGGGYAAATPGYAVAGGYGQQGVLVEPFKPLTPTGSLNPHLQPSVEMPTGTGRTRRRLRAPVQNEQEEKQQFFAIPGVKKEPPTVKAAPPEPPKPAATVTHMSKDNGMTVTDIPFKSVPTNAKVDLKWVPFPGQLYLPAYCEHFQKLEIERLPTADGKNFINHATVKDLEIEEMNRADHAITTAHSLYRDMSPTNQPRLERLIADLNLTARAVKAMSSLEDGDTTESFRELNLVEADAVFKGEDSLISFVTTARVRRMQVQTAGERSAFTVTGSIVTNFVVDQKLAAPLFSELAALDTFDEVADTLKDFTKKNQTEQAASLVWRIDRYLRRELLHVIRKRMGLSDFVFDSFIDDQKDVFAVLAKDCGTAYSKALARYQSQFLKALFGEKSVAYADDDTPLVSSEPLSTVTLLDIDYDEFGVRINDNVAHEVFSTNFPGLYDFIKAVVVNNPNVLHHYIITEDDHVFEVNRSVVGEEIYLLSNGPALV